MLDALYTAAPGLETALNDHPLVNNPDLLWDALRRLLLAHGPSGGAWLPGAIVDEIASLAGSMGLADRFIPLIGSTGNAGIWLGAEKKAADLVVVSHMDRPSFRVRDAANGLLYPICADRFPPGEYRVPAKALRFENGALTVGARGTLVSVHNDQQNTLRFEATVGQLLWQDTLTMDVAPTLNDGLIKGTGLDNCMGVLTMLCAASALMGIEGTLRAHDRRILFVFTDMEEGIPEAFFGHGAARLMHAIPPPSTGCIVADAQTVTAGGPLVMGHGAGYGTVSAWSRGSIVPPNYIALAIDLAAALNARRAHTVQLNTGYLSRSDDMALGRWTQILGMIGAPMADAHTGHETGRLKDIPSAIWWLAHYTAAVLALNEGFVRRYALQL